MSESGLLDLYLDGMLPEGERLAFEQRLASDPQLQAQVEAQRAIDASLKGCSAPPPAPALRPAPATFSLKPAAWYRNPRVLSAAASLLIAVSVWRIWSATHRPTPVNVYNVPPWQTMEMAWKQQVAKGLVPMWKCENDQQLASAFYNKFGQALLVNPLPANMEIAGLSYGNVHSSRTIEVLAKVDGEPVVIFADTVDNCDADIFTAGAGLRDHTLKVGPFTLHEVSRSDKPNFLDRFYVKQMPPQWIKEAPKFKFEPPSMK